MSHSQALVERTPAAGPGCSPAAKRHRRLQKVATAAHTTSSLAHTRSRARKTDLGFDIAAGDLGILRLTRGAFVDVVVVAAGE